MVQKHTPRVFIIIISFVRELNVNSLSCVECVSLKVEI